MGAPAKNIYLTQYMGPDGKPMVGPDVVADDQKDADKRIERLEMEMLGMGFSWIFVDLKVIGRLVEREYNA